MIALETNLIIRYAIKDDPHQALGGSVHSRGRAAFLRWSVGTI